MVDSKLFIANLSSRVRFINLDNWWWFKRAFREIWKDCERDDKEKKRLVEILI